MISARLEDKDGATELSEDDTAVGAWSGVGMYAELTSHFIMGLDVRYSKAEATLLSEDREAGGLKTGITIGYHWYSEFVWSCFCFNPSLEARLSGICFVHFVVARNEE